MSSVNYQRFSTRQYNAWRKVRACCDGEEEVKRLPGVLLALNPGDRSPENRLRNQQYRERAVYFNATGRTRDGLIGLAFAKDPDVDFGKFDYLADDANGQGVSIYHAAQKGLAGVMETGRHGFLTDLVNDRPAIIGYNAEDIINWRYESNNDKRRLVLLVLREWVQEPENDWSDDCIEQFRVYRLNNDIVSVEVWRDGNKGTKGRNNANYEIYQQPDILLPSTATRHLKEIPFAPVGAKSNSLLDCDVAPLLGLANMNLAHFRNSADYEDSVFFCGQVQAWCSGLDIEWRDKLIEQGIYIGSRNVLLLPANGQFGMTQAQANTMAKEAMDNKEKLMVAIGARVVEQSEITKTATQAAGDLATGTSVLGLCAGNASEAITRALRWCGLFGSAKAFDGAKFAITQKFDEQVMDPQKLTAMVEAWQAGAFPVTDLRDYLKRVGALAPERTNADMDAEVEAEAADKLKALAKETAITKPAPTPGPNNGRKPTSSKTPSFG
jgi:hypothetical protein